MFGYSKITSRSVPEMTPEKLLNKINENLAQ
jgi:hypothetical protein